MSDDGSSLSGNGDMGFQRLEPCLGPSLPGEEADILAVADISSAEPDIPDELFDVSDVPVTMLTDTTDSDTTDSDTTDSDTTDFDTTDSDTTDSDTTDSDTTDFDTTDSDTTDSDTTDSDTTDSDTTDSDTTDSDTTDSDTTDSDTTDSDTTDSDADPVTDPDLQKLREFLFLREMNSLRDLKRRLDDPLRHARDISAVVAEALLLRMQEKDRLLHTALEPLTEEIVKGALRKNPMDFVNVLFPLMGPAIRRSIAENFHSMLEGFHKTIGQVFSWKGLRWRWQAWRTGVSFSEVVLLNTLLYKVEQIFFIHLETGLVLCHVSSEDATTQDADMVSAMLTAIQDFARDCFASGQESLDSLKMGDFTVLLERGVSAYLACVVRGAVPMEFREKLRDMTAVLQLKYADELDVFTGDVGKFESARWTLEDLLDARYANEGAALPFWIKLLPVVLGILLIIGAGYWGHNAYQESLRRKYTEESFAQVGAEPGLLLMETRRDQDGHWLVIYQKDQLAKDPAALLNSRGIDPDTYTLRVIPAVSYEASIVIQRVEKRIAPPESVVVEFDKGTLYLRGTAPMSWILQARQEAMALPGVERIDTSGMSDPRVDELKRMIARVESAVIEFPSGKDTPVPEDAAELSGAMDALAAIEKLATSMNVAVSLTVYGHADATGDSKRNYEISQARARMIAAMLYARGSSIPISMYGMGSDYANKEERPDAKPGTRRKVSNQSSRRVELKVHLAQLPSGEGILNLLN